ncbi:MAG: DUF4389 domain-containing protein [Gammaproteobacteria bacterium]|nr:DUF4389 domain-containing protein [Gammaproteobacteria bacterium]
MNETDPAADDVAVEGDTSAPIEDNIKSRSTWLRGLFMCIYCVLFWLASIVGATVVIIGFFWVLFTGEKNTQLGQVGQGIAGYVYEIVRYLTFNTDDKPFPFGAPWPAGGTEETG